MKKLLSTFTLALLAAASAWAQTFTVDNLKYTITDETTQTVELTGYETKPTGALDIPATVSYNSTSYSVTSIRDLAFQYCRSLTQVTISDGVTSIGYEAFHSCSALTQVTIPDGVTSIGEDAFYNTALYKNADNWTNNVLYIDNCLIAAKTKLSGSYKIATGTRVIADGAFYYCSALTQVNIPDGVTSIGGSTFANCSALTQVTIGDGVTSIGYSAFRDCSALKQVSIPDGVTSIGSYAFSGCSALKQVTIPGSVESIREWAFEYCSALAEITVLATVPPTITAYTFSNINPQVKVNIPEGSRDAYMADENWKWLLDLSAGQLSGTCGDNLTWTFTTADCTLSISGRGEMYDYNYPSDQPWYNFNQGIKNISLPDGMTSIGNWTFQKCLALTQINIPDGVTSIGSYAFSSCSALTQVDIPGSVTSIGDQAFVSCEALTQVDIGNGVTSIGNGAFYECSALAEMTVLATVPPTIGGASTFYNVSRNIPVYVPAESLKDYQAAVVWKEFTNLHAMPTGLQTPSMPESIRVYGGMLHNPQGLPVSIYDMQGRMVYSGTAATVSQPAGVYVVLCAGASRKVLF